MIEKLYIKDFAIVNELEISFNNGLTIITGETGSGKSILLQALNVSLGSKTSKTMVRSNAERAIIETKLKSAAYRRVLNKSGRTKSYLDDEPLSESDFRLTSTSLVDFHGQHEHAGSPFVETVDRAGVEALLLEHFPADLHRRLAPLPAAHPLRRWRRRIPSRRRRRSQRPLESPESRAKLPGDRL